MLHYHINDASKCTLRMFSQTFTTTTQGKFCKLFPKIIIHVSSMTSSFLKHMCAWFLWVN